MPTLAIISHLRSQENTGVSCVYCGESLTRAIDSGDSPEVNEPYWITLDGSIWCHKWPGNIQQYHLAILDLAA